jgi:phytoene dehydrogenase-like protein
MNNNSDDNSIIIIGAGFAGLAAGIYAQMNGFKTQIFEMQDKPGGLCTSWNRKGYTIDGCIHWLVGSSPDSGMHRYWKEVGIAQNREFIYMDEYMRFEDTDGRNFTFFTDVDRLEKHLLEFSPQDAEPINEFISGIRMCIPFDKPSKNNSLLMHMVKQVRIGFSFLINSKKMKKWMKMTSEDFSNRFKDQLIKQAFKEMWIPEFSMFFMLFTFACLHNRNAGYPLGGSMPMSRALESRYRNLGGVINYGKKVEKIITSGEKTTGIRLDDGTMHYSSKVISAADGYTTIFRMLDGKYADEKTREPFDKWPTFPPLIYVGLGVKRTFDELPRSVSGFSFALNHPVEICDSIIKRLCVHIYNHDPSLAPAGCTCMTIMVKTNYEYWKKLAENKSAYNQKKEEIANMIIKQLEQRFPGISSQVEVTDIATPITFERYTGNWKGSFEGWLITPGNSRVLLKPMSQSLPGLNNFYMCGQWVEPGGGLPTGIMSGRRLVKRLCKEENRKFRTSVD